MRILHVVPYFWPAARYGGPVFATRGLCRALAARGHQVEVFTTDVGSEGRAAQAQGACVPLDGFQVRYFAVRFPRRLFRSQALKAAVNEAISRFDVLHISTVFLAPTWAAARVSRRARVPYVVSPMGMLTKDLIRRKNPLAKTAWLNLVERMNMEEAAAIHVASQLEAAELRKFRWRIPEASIIPHGVDEPEPAAGNPCSADVAEIAKHQPLVLFFGRISWKKGLDRLLRAFARTRQGILVIAGPDDENLTPRLAQQARALDLGERVRFMPRLLLGVDKERLLAAAKLFVLPSYSENFGIAVVEAMRRGLPVVVTPEVGAAEIVQVSGGGVVVEGMPEPLAGSIDRLLADPARARSMGLAGQDYVTEFLAWPRIAGQMEKLYARLAAHA